MSTRLSKRGDGGQDPWPVDETDADSVAQSEAWTRKSNVTDGREAGHEHRRCVMAGPNDAQFWARGQESSVHIVRGVTRQMNMRIDEPWKDRRVGVLQLLCPYHRRKPSASTDVAQSSSFDQDRAIFHWRVAGSVYEPTRADHERTPASKPNDVRHG
jgi:hypothetical protein